MNHQSETYVAGAGFAELPIPIWIRVCRLVIAVGIFFLICTAAFVLNGWSWLTTAAATGPSVRFALAASLVVTLSFAVAALLWRLGAINRLFNVRRASGGKLFVFGGFRNAASPFFCVALTALSIVACGALLREIVRTFPLPRSLNRQALEVTAIASHENLVPIYLWDYSTWINPEFFKQMNLVLPYEKGPPQKLLPKVYFEDSKSHAIVLELHGKRPRHYDQKELNDVFSSSLPELRDWPLVLRLEHEAALSNANETVDSMSLIELRHAGNTSTYAIGSLWDKSTNGPTNAGRFFYWGPDGSVFQVKCPSPCNLSRSLELVQFPLDPKGSLASRLEWTKKTLQTLLEKIQSDPVKRQENETLLSLYLISLLTLDPRDPEAFFHLGKMARNRETILSAIRYGKDLGMERAQILELEGVLDRYSIGR